MRPGVKERFLWGRQRLFLGLAQIAFVGLSVGALVTVGLKSITWFFYLARLYSQS